ncbi:MAG TPA: YggT family protein [Pyrinomonadaceae bacterium]|nr:YggT family protein [Pyrinomonadaceae bacterium]
MFLIVSTYLLITYLVTAVIVATIVLMLLRLILNYADVNPFSWSSLTIRRLTDPLVTPVRRTLAGFGVDPKIAPLITVLLVILLGWFCVQLAASVLNTLAGVIHAAPRGAFVAVAGYLLYGLLAFYTLLIFIRIIFSWGMVSYANPVMRFLVNTTDPLLLPLRRMIPPLGMFDLSPIVAFIILWLFQAAIAGTLLISWPLNFVR